VAHERQAQRSELTVATEQLGHEAFLIVRVWFEAPHPRPFRARLLIVVGDNVLTQTLARNEEEVLRAVQGWLASLNAVE